MNHEPKLMYFNLCKLGEYTNFKCGITHKLYKIETCPIGKVRIGKEKNRRFKPWLKEGTAVTGGLGLCIPITLHCNVQLHNLITTSHRDTKFQTVNLDT